MAQGKAEKEKTMLKIKTLELQYALDVLNKVAHMDDTMDAQSAKLVALYIANLENTEAELQEKLKASEDMNTWYHSELARVKEQRTRRNLQIANLKKALGQQNKEAIRSQDLFDQILYISNIHGVYKDDTDCLNAIRNFITEERYNSYKQ